MKRISFDRSGFYNYSVLITDTLKSAEEELIEHIKGRRAFVFTDKNVFNLHFAELGAILERNGIEYEYLAVEGGEAVKNFQTLTRLLERLAYSSFSRDDFIINLGGGVIGDIGGFAAAIYMRGMNYINIPTTLLGMVDSAMGGKTGIDFMGIKNTVGAVYQPKLVIEAIAMLSTLDDTALRSGMGEIVKYAAICGDSALVSGFAANKHIDKKTIARCCEIKRDYVIRDEFDNGRRRILNLGHTFGHAFEAGSQYELSHGEAVGLGLIAEASYGERLGIVESGTAEEIRMLLKSIGAKTDYEPFKACGASFIAHDKKSDGTNIEMALVKRMGQPFLYRTSIESAISFLKN